jgi:tetratricopeptide (TPR) repeat protein
VEPPTPPADRLDSWKESAGYLGRTERTARRWERGEGLPVRRLAHAERGSVYAFKSELDAWRAERSIPTPAETAAGALTPGRTRIWLRAGAGGAVALTLIVGASLWRASSGPVGARLQTLAILPFATDPSGESQLDLGFAIAEALVGHLAGAPDLRVRPFDSAHRHSRAGDEPAAIGARLGADVVATGRVRADGETVQIKVALLDVAANLQVWGTSYDTNTRDLGRTQERIALAIRERVLRLAYGPSFQPAAYEPSNPLSQNPDALWLFIRARAFGQNPRRASVLSAINYLLEAVRLDPGFVRAYEVLAIAHIAVTVFGEEPPSEAMARAKAYAAKALELDQRSAWARVALAGASHWYDFDYERAESNFRAAIAVDPSLAVARNWYAEFLIDMLRFDEALAASRAAEEHAPGWLKADTVTGNVHLFSGQPELAISLYLRALESEPHHGLSRYFLGQAYLVTGRHAEAVAELRSADDTLGRVPFSRAGLGHALARAGERDEAEAMLAEMARQRGEAQYPAFALAIVHMGLGDADAALDWLERAVEERLLGYYMPSVDPTWVPLRQHPHFKDLLRRLNLPELR